MAGVWVVDLAESIRSDVQRYSVAWKKSRTREGERPSPVQGTESASGHDTANIYVISDHDVHITRHKGITHTQQVVIHIYRPETR